MQADDNASTFAFGAVVLRQDFGGQEIQQHGSLAPIAAAAATGRDQCSASWRRDRKPRNIDLFEQKIVHLCRKPGFAEIALYHKPVGKEKNPATGQWEQAFATNFSVRFVEQAIQFFTNTHNFARIVFEDDHRMLLSVGVVDVEYNTGYTFDQMIEKTVERSDARGRRERSSAA